jgi:hypothetical protein
MSLQKDGALPDDPAEIAASLVEENGLERARQITVDGTTAANERGNFYRLSIWREVKSILADWKEAPDAGP